MISHCVISLKCDIIKNYFLKQILSNFFSADMTVQGVVF